MGTKRMGTKRIGDEKDGDEMWGTKSGGRKEVDPYRGGGGETQIILSNNTLSSKASFHKFLGGLGLVFSCTN